MLQQCLFLSEDITDKKTKMLAVFSVFQCSQFEFQNGYHRSLLFSLIVANRFVIRRHNSENEL